MKQYLHALMLCALPTIFHTHSQTHTLQPNVSSGCRVDGVLCSERSDSEWRSQEAHVEVESSTSPLKWLAFMLHIVLELEERATQVQKTNFFQKQRMSVIHTALSKSGVCV